MPTVVMTPGDSITAAGLWQAELVRLCGLVDVTLDVRNVAVGGARTTYWPGRIGGLLAEHRPDLVTFFTGTNDDPDDTVYGENATGWAWRSTVETIRTYRTPPVRICPAFIQYSDPLIAPDWLLANQPRTNDTIYAQFRRYAAAGWFVGLADFQQIPATASFLDDGGVHPNERGYKAMGRIVYDAIAAGMGWPRCLEPPLRDMYGHRKGYSRPGYLPSTGG